MRKSFIRPFKPIFIGDLDHFLVIHYYCLGSIFNVFCLFVDLVVSIIFYTFAVENLTYLFYDTEYTDKEVM